MAKRVSLLIFFIFASTSQAYAKLIVINDSDDTVLAESYLSQNSIINKDYKKTKIVEKKKKIKVEGILYPNRSNLTYGKVAKRHLDIKHLPPTPIFVIGADEQSVKWAKTNAKYLKQIHAIGYITNIESKKREEEIKKQTQLLLINVNMDGLGKILGVEHYPFLIYHNWIVQ